MGCLKKYRFRHVVGLLAVCALLAGCVVIVRDFPKAIMGAAKYAYGVTLLHVKPPYEIRSSSDIRGFGTSSPGAQRDQLSDERLLTHGTYRNWRWQIWATPQVAASWTRWRSSRAPYACPNEHCRPLSWKFAFTRLYRVMHYLLGEPPLPLSLRLNLIPAGFAFTQSILRKSRRAVPLVFTFPYPSTLRTSVDAQKKREQAFAHVLGMVSYEFQHVEYAAHDTSGPRSSSQGIRTLKNEANSECWNLSAKIAVLGGTSYTLSIPLSTISTLSDLYGNVVQLKTDAVWGPALLRRDLALYLERVAPATVGVGYVRISLSDYPVLNQVLAYCRGFTRYPGDIARGHMPILQVARTRYWPVAPNPSRQ